MGKYFGTDGFRGEAGIDLTADHAYKVGRFLGWYYNALRERNGDNNPARIVIGKDTRRSSYMFEYSLVAGLTASGADAYLLHVTTTPSVAYIARVDDFDCGIMISASHNPYYDNGIKLIDCYGEKMPEEILLLVEDYIDGKLHVFDKDWPELPFAHREHIGCTVDYVAGRNRYMGYLISLGIYSFKGVKVGLDCANGSSWNIAKSVFDALGADTYVINNKPNGLNINNNAGSTHIEGLQKFVVERGLDIGFAYDGDDIELVCVQSALPPYRLQNENMDDAHEYFAELCGEYDVPFYDFNYLKDEYLSRTDDDYVDLDGHMMGELADRQSAVLGQILIAENKKEFFYDNYDDVLSHLN